MRETAEKKGSYVYGQLIPVYVYVLNTLPLCAEREREGGGSLSKHCAKGIRVLGGYMVVKLEE